MIAYRVSIWMCVEDGDHYLVRPQDQPLRLADCMNWHRLMAHGGRHPEGKHLTWTVYVNPHWRERRWSA